MKLINSHILFSLIALITTSTLLVGAPNADSSSGSTIEIPYKVKGERQPRVLTVKDGHQCIVMPTLGNNGLECTNEKLGFDVTDQTQLAVFIGALKKNQIAAKLKYFSKPDQIPKDTVRGLLVIQSSAFKANKSLFGTISLSPKSELKKRFQLKNGATCDITDRRLANYSFEAQADGKKQEFTIVGNAGLGQPPHVSEVNYVEADNSFKIVPNVIDPSAVKRGLAVVLKGDGTARFQVYKAPPRKTCVAVIMFSDPLKLSTGLFNRHAQFVSGTHTLKIPKLSVALRNEGIVEPVYENLRYGQPSNGIYAYRPPLGKPRSQQKVTVHRKASEPEVFDPKAKGAADEKEFMKLQTEINCQPNKVQPTLSIPPQDNRDDQSFAEAIVDSWISIGIKVVAFDFDSTLVAQHWPNGAVAVEEAWNAKPTPGAEHLIRACQKRGIKLWIATFQDHGRKTHELSATTEIDFWQSKDLEMEAHDGGVTAVSKVWGPSRIVEWGDCLNADNYRPRGPALVTRVLANSNLQFTYHQPMNIIAFLPSKGRKGSMAYGQNKTFHLHIIKNLEKVKKEEILLVDDSYENCRAAVDCGFCAVEVPTKKTGVVLNGIIPFAKSAW